MTQLVVKLNKIKNKGFSMNWHTNFKVALNKKDMITIDNLLNKIPEFKNIEEMRQAYTLIGNVKQLFENKQLMIQQNMNTISQQRAL